MSRPSALLDTARTEICNRFAALLNAGARQVRVRVSLTGKEPQAIWFYSHQNNEWHKSTDELTAPDVVGLVAEQMELIGSKPHGDVCSSRRHQAADFVDTDLTFHDDKIAGHVGDGLATFVFGLLFRDDHDSNQDRRQSLRHGAAGH